MGIADYIKNPQNPTRLKEYLFITSLALIAALYGVLHDVITFSISREYFEIAKNLGEGVRFWPAVFKLAIQASYWVGVIIGVLLVVANTTPKRNQLPYKTLYKNLMWIFFISFCGSLIAFGASFFFTPYFSIGGEGILKQPQRFEMVAFIHWGTYIGALIGALFALSSVISARIKLFRANS